MGFHNRPRGEPASRRVARVDGGQAGQARVVGWANKTEEKETGERFEVSQVKDKFGTLRFYGNHHTDAIDGRFEQAAVEALHTCETCGWEGRQREPGGANACDEHAQDLG